MPVRQPVLVVVVSIGVQGKLLTEQLARAEADAGFGTSKPSSQYLSAMNEDCPTALALVNFAVDLGSCGGVLCLAGLGLQLLDLGVLAFDALSGVLDLHFEQFANAADAAFDPDAQGVELSRRDAVQRDELALEGGDIRVAFGDLGIQLPFETTEQVGRIIQRRMRLYAALKGADDLRHLR